MTKYREILRLYSQGISQRNIAISCESSRNTVSNTLKRAEAGQTTPVIDSSTGEAISVYILVAVLSSSKYAYVEAFLSQNQECWITAHINAYEFFEGVTRILTPDNLKTGVDRVSWYTPIINKTYHEMSEHYGTAVIPTRVRKPKDKASVEGTVGVISTWIIAALRHQKLLI